MRAWKAANHGRVSARRRELYALRTADAKADAERRKWERDPYRARARILYHGMWTRSRRWSLPFDKSALGVDSVTSWLIRQPRCECCGEDFALVPEGRAKSDRSPSIDRLVPPLGYVPGNVALLCWRCNNLKRDASSDELRRIADWMDART